MRFYRLNDAAGFQRRKCLLLVILLMALSVFSLSAACIISSKSRIGILNVFDGQGSDKSIYFSLFSFFVDR